jgi:hypothetical protein
MSPPVSARHPTDGPSLDMITPLVRPPIRQECASGGLRVQARSLPDAALMWNGLSSGPRDFLLRAFGAR